TYGCSGTPRAQRSPERLTVVETIEALPQGQWRDCPIVAWGNRPIHFVNDARRSTHAVNEGPAHRCSCLHRQIAWETKRRQRTGEGSGARECELRRECMRVRRIERGTELDVRHAELRDTVGESVLAKIEELAAREREAPPVDDDRIEAVADADRQAHRCERR